MTRSYLLGTEPAAGRLVPAQKISAQRGTVDAGTGSQWLQRKHFQVALQQAQLGLNNLQRK
jgi:hypothetical protein